MAGRRSFKSTSAGSVTSTDTGLSIQTQNAQGGVVHACFESNAGAIILKHVFEDGTERDYQTVSCSAGVLNVVNFAHKTPHCKVYYTHTGAGVIRIEVTSFK